ncbi:MAG TPA: PKD domain-containing protein [Verrucomicrobiae bacterium]|nr:PKD domain-containing protein [Verrucomicrobiae bacterium]
MSELNRQPVHGNARPTSKAGCRGLQVSPGHGWRSCVLFAVGILYGALVRADGQTFPYFTNVYGGYGTNFIYIAPWTAQGIFYEGDTITISNRVGTAVEVYDYHFNPITNATPPVVLSNLGLGHYFVQVDDVKKGREGDRAQFTVLPRAYTNHPHADIGELPTGTAAEHYRFQRLAPGFSRLQGWWGPTSTVTESGGIVNDSGTYDWTEFDQMLQSYSNVPVRVMNLIVSHCTNGWHSPVVDTTNSLNSWVTDVAVLYSNAAVRYGTNFVYEIINEPSESNMQFPTNQDPYALTDPGVLPTAMAVSASVQAIRFVCPSCQTWAPSSRSFAMWPARTLTDSFAVAYYANVDALSAHGASAYIYGPMDCNVAYTNRQDMGTWWPTEANDRCVAKLYPGKPFYITETYPMAPDVLGKTNGWYLTVGGGWTLGSVPQFGWDWRLMTTRFWKDLIEAKATGVAGTLMWLGLVDSDMDPHDPPVAGALATFSGWDLNGEPYDSPACGPKPTVDGQAMLSWWLTGSRLIADWLSGSPLVVVNPQGGVGSGTPGLHFWEFEFADGTTNTILWADEETTVTTNLGVGLTDIYSNAWTGPIGIEPVIAWGWPNNRLGGVFSVQPVAAIDVTPTVGVVPLTVTFTDVSAGAITNRIWQFGDGFVTNTPEIAVVHQYTAPGTNTVQLTISGPNGVSDVTKSNMIVVTDFFLPLNPGSITNLPPFSGGTTGSTTTVQSPHGNGSPRNNWRIMIAY